MHTSTSLPSDSPLNTVTDNEDNKDTGNDTEDIDDESLACFVNKKALDKEEVENLERQADALLFMINDRLHGGDRYKSRRDRQCDSSAAYSMMRSLKNIHAILKPHYASLIKKEPRVASGLCEDRG